MATVLRHASATTTIAATPERVFAAVADPRKPFLTRSPFVRMELGSAQTSGSGTLYRWAFRLPCGFRLPGWTFGFDEVVTAWEAPRRLAYRAVRGWAMEATTVMEPSAGGTRLTFTIDYHLPRPWSWLVTPFLERLGTGWAVARIKRLVEALPPGATAARRGPDRRIGELVLGWAARRALVGRDRAPADTARGRFTRGDVDRLLRRAWQAYDARAHTLPPQPTRGAAMNVHLALLTLTFCDGLLSAGVDRSRAIELTADAAWAVYGAYGRMVWVLTRVSRFHRRRGSGTPGTVVPLQFPFGPPAYEARWVETPGGRGFDMLRCPVAEVFRAAGAIDLCRAAWCDLDFPLYEMADERLVRTTTLVEGGGRCDFRSFPALTR